jgi:hypothetical protein
MIKKKIRPEKNISHSENRVFLICLSFVSLSQLKYLYEKSIVLIFVSSKKWIF